MLAVMAAAVALAYGCASVPRGYDADLTPTHNGEAWVGGAPLAITADARAAMREHLQREGWCAWCQSRADLEVHHIIPRASRPDLAADDANMITLCHRDHRTIGHPGGDTRCWVSNLRQLCTERLLCGPGTDAP